MSGRPGSPDGEPRRLGEALDRVVAGLGAPAAAVGDVFGRWEELVGPTVAAHARPVALRGRTLVLAVDDPAWATQVRFLADDLCRRLAASLGPDAPDAVEVRVRRTSRS